MNPRWSTESLRWYHAIPEFDRTPWWLKEGSKPAVGLLDEENKDLFESTIKGRKILRQAPARWELSRRHPDLREAWIELRPMAISALEESNRKDTKFGEFCGEVAKRFCGSPVPVLFLLVHGHMAWPGLSSSVQERFSQSTGTASLNPDADLDAMRPLQDVLLPSPLAKRRVAFEVEEPTEKRRVCELIEEASKRGSRLMIVEVDPNASPDLVARHFKEVFAERYGAGECGFRNTKQNLITLSEIDGDRPLAYETLRKAARLFSNLQMLR